MTCSQPVHELRQFIKDYSALPRNWRDNRSWPLGLFFHGECINVYGYTWIGPTVIYDIRLSSSHDFTKLFIVLSLNLERILSLS